MENNDRAVEVQEIPGGYRFCWPTWNLAAIVNRISENRRGKSTSAEIRILSTAPGLPGHLYQGRTNLTSPTAKRTLRSELLEQDQNVPWMEVVEFLCTETLRRWRTGEPVVRVGTLPTPDTPTYRLWPILPEAVPTIIYGEGGSFKSYLALMVSLLVQTGEARWGLTPIQGNVLYLDYEASQDEVNERIKALCSGLGLPPTNILYRFCVAPLENDIERIQEVVAEAQIGLAVVDSAGLACGGNLIEAEPALAMFPALRSLKTSSLIVDHVAKNTNPRGKTTPYGTVYKPNAARSVWELRREQEMGADHIQVGLFHRKTNRGRLHYPIGFKVQFDDEVPAVYFEREDVRDIPELSQFLTVKDQIKELLRDGAKTAKELAEHLEKGGGTVRKELRRLGAAVVKLPDGRWALRSERLEVETIPF